METGRRLVQIGGERVEIEHFDVPEPGPGGVVKGGEIMYHLGGRALRCGV